jgi:hypothetical protein
VKQTLRLGRTGNDLPSLIHHEHTARETIMQRAGETQPLDAIGFVILAT